MAQKKGYRHKEETKESISKSMRGKKNPMYGIYGEDNPSVKLTQQEAMEILSHIRRKSMGVSALMKKFNVGKTTIYNIKHGRHWINRQLEGEEDDDVQTEG